MAITPKPIIDITARNLSKVPASRGGNPIQFIVVHYLGVDGQNPDLYCVGAGDCGYGGHFNIFWNGDIYRAADPNSAVVWHCGGGRQGYDPGSGTYFGICTNFNSIGIECSVHYDGTWYFTTETQESLVYLVSTLMDTYGIDMNHVIRHWDVTGKHCPAPYVENTGYKTNWTWDGFKAKLAAYRGGGSEDDEIAEEFKKDRVTKGYDKHQYRIISDDTIVRLAPDKDAPQHPYWGKLSKGNGCQEIAQFDSGYSCIMISAGANTGTIGYVPTKNLAQEGEDEMISDVFKKRRIAKGYNEHKYRTVTKDTTVRLAPDPEAPKHPYWGKLSKGNGCQEIARFDNDWSCVYIVAGAGTGTIGYVNSAHLK